MFRRCNLGKALGKARVSLGRTGTSESGMISVWIALFLLLVVAIIAYGFTTLTNLPIMRRPAAIRETERKAGRVAAAVMDYILKSYQRTHTVSFPSSVDDLVASGFLTEKESYDVWKSKFVIYFGFPCDTSTSCPFPATSAGCDPENVLSYPQLLVLSPGPNHIQEATTGYIASYFNSHGVLPSELPDTIGGRKVDDVVLFTPLAGVFKTIAEDFKTRVIQPISQAITDYWSLRYQACCKFYGEDVAGDKGWKSCPVSFDLPLSCIYSGGNIREEWKDLFDPNTCTESHPLCSWASLEDMLTSKLGSDCTVDPSGANLNFLGADISGGEIFYKIEIPCYVGRSPTSGAILVVKIPPKVYQAPASQF